MLLDRRSALDLTNTHKHALHKNISPSHHTHTHLCTIKLFITKLYVKKLKYYYNKYHESRQLVNS